MKKIFEEYGSVILIVFIVVSLIATTGLFYKGDGTGWLEVAFEEQGLTNPENTSSESDIEVSDTVYTLDFIEGNEYLYAAGATQQEYVVAAFDMDFSNVYILTNGKESDGTMADFDEDSSPVAQKAATVINAYVEDGVCNIGDYTFYGCDKLESVTISNSVESISANAFSSCSALNTIYGVGGSYAETFANENGYTFVPV